MFEFGIWLQTYHPLVSFLDKLQASENQTLMHKFNSLKSLNDIINTFYHEHVQESAATMNAEKIAISTQNLNYFNEMLADLAIFNKFSLKSVYQFYHQALPNLSVEEAAQVLTVESFEALLRLKLHSVQG